MGIKYLWDTNTVIYFLQQQFPTNGEKFMDELIRYHTPCFSVITEMELLCWKTVNQNDLQILQNFINDASVIELEQAIKFKTADIRKQYKIKLPDAIIAATALVHNRTLISRNTSDFKKINELLIVDPFNI